jgi:DNA polymerase
MPRTLYVDIETRSPVNLKKSGVYRYAENRWTQIIVLSWAIDDAPIRSWYIIYGEPCPDELREAILDPSVRMVAHNASFERVVLSIVGARCMPADIVACFRDVTRWNCTAARACCYGLPRSLDNVAHALHLSVSKDEEGKRIMLRMCAPCAINQDGTPVWVEGQELVYRLGAYCEVDVEVERHVDRTLPNLIPMERRLWELTEKMNDRGIEVDNVLLEKTTKLVQIAEKDVNNRINIATNGQVPKVSNHQALKEWLIGLDIGYDELPGVGKPVISEMLESEELPEFVREVLIMRQEGSKSSAAKYKAIGSRINVDSRVRGALLYCGASATLRYSSIGVQLQNLPRGGKIKNLMKSIDAIYKDASLQEIREEFGPPLVVASELLRPVFQAPPGYWLVRGDYSQIESRCLSFLAGQTNKLAAFAAYDAGDGPDLYITTAADIHGVSKSAIDKDDPRRQTGKVAELACIAIDQLVKTNKGLVPIQNVTTDMLLWDGEEWVEHDGLVFRGHKHTIIYDGLEATEDHQVYIRGEKYTAGFGLVAEQGRILQGGCGSYLIQDKFSRPVFDILNAGPRNRFTVSGRLVHNCGYQGGMKAFQAFAKIYNLKISDEEADKIKNAWREANPKIVQFWWDLDNAAKDCLRAPPGQRFEVRPGLWFNRTDSVMLMRKPSGNSLAFWYPKLAMAKTQWGEREAVCYYSLDRMTNKWSVQWGYGGLYAAMATQSFARDIMALALLNLEDEKLSPVLTVHDEAVCQVLKTRYPTESLAKKAIVDVMMRLPAFAHGMPIAVDASAGTRYLKG